MHVYGGVCLDEHDVERMHDDDGDLCDVPWWEFLLWWRRSTLSVCRRLFSWSVLSGCSVYCMHM